MYLLAFGCTKKKLKGMVTSVVGVGNKMFSFKVTLAGMAESQSALTAAQQSPTKKILLPRL